MLAFRGTALISDVSLNGVGSRLQASLIVFDVIDILETLDQKVDQAAHPRG